MNEQKLLNALKTVNANIKRKQFFSAEQLKVFKRTRAKLNKQLKQYIDPNATPKPLIKSNDNPQLPLL